MATEVNEIVFTVTHAGRNAALNAEAVGLILKLDKMGFGDGHGVSDKTVTSLASKKQETDMSASGVQPTTNTLLLGVNYTPTQDLYLSEIGIYTVDGVLFAIARKTDGHFFILSKDIPFIASFGLRLADINEGTVAVSVMQDAPIAQQMIFDHESHPDPHPQYSKGIGDLKNYFIELFNEFTENIGDTFNEFKNEVANNLEVINKEIERIWEHLNEITYPRTIVCGVAMGEKFTIDVSGKVDDLRDNKYLIQVTPENTHEAWEIKREAQSFTVTIWNRSGSNRIGYSGSANWAVIQATGETVAGGNGDYYAGRYFIQVLPNETKDFILVSGGGAGGVSAWQDYPIWNGGNGGVTSLYLDSVKLVEIDGGHGGPCGHWSNGSSMIDGTEGTRGGIYVSELVTQDSKVLGIIGGNKLADHKGGISVSVVGQYGAGGNGADGVGDDGRAFGTGGTSGGYAKIKYKNTTEAIQTLTLVVGAGGESPESNGNPGFVGTNGFARVSN
ncbi:phage tail protein [Acinetobacter sp. CFCC 10889]|uniref:phage tail-collar fiber domain-containing protein n=1 Tax=Acinetobacter sp. CFCC 10889 TaxID=1775557 RepID=UPI000DD0886A|nr:phage tail protein [Acinetobacter sp. CFCC 10889]